MGLFDKLKAVKNTLTGGAAKVFVEAKNATLREPFEVTIRAIPQGVDVKYDRVYLKIEGQERISINGYKQSGSDNATINVHESKTTMSLEFDVVPAGELKNGETGEWKVMITLPDSATPEYRGTHATHSYFLWAGLDCFGNDPDSGWQEITVQ